MEAQETKEVKIDVVLTLTKTFKFKMSQEEIEELKIDDIIDDYLLNEFIEKHITLPQEAWSKLKMCACLGNNYSPEINKQIEDLKGWEIDDLVTTSCIFD